MKKSWFFSNLIDDNLSSTERNFVEKTQKSFSFPSKQQKQSGICTRPASRLANGGLVCDYVAEHHPDVSAQLVGMDKIRDISISANSTADVELTFMKLAQASESTSLQTFGS